MERNSGQIAAEALRDVFMNIGIELNCAVKYLEQMFDDVDSSEIANTAYAVILGIVKGIEQHPALNVPLLSEDAVRHMQKQGFERVGEALRKAGAIQEEVSE